jgi:hypothetical protein
VTLEEVTAKAADIAYVQSLLKVCTSQLNGTFSTKTLITNKCTKRVLSSIVTHSYMFRPCWVIFRENFFVVVTLRLGFIFE